MSNLATNPPAAPKPRVAIRLARKALFYAVIAAVGLVILGSIGSAIQIIYIKMAHPSRPQDQSDQEQ